jgi:GalNAc-alpha-(1->4)-GalNAc-alpha-(1->3)-diNAcBac-PP-undecaprenol alpha-1,4-N-acetyl-D-galactosaminyltransferase
MKIMCVISSLSSGGAERVLVAMAEAFTRKGHTVAITTLYGSELDFYALPPGVERTALGVGKDSKTMWQAIRHNVQRIQAIRRAVVSASPDVVISLIDRTNVLVLFALMFTRIPVIVSERVDPRRISCGRLWHVLRWLLYPAASALVSISRGVDESFTWLPRSKRWVIYNPLLPIDQASRLPVSGAPSSSKRRIAAMGRLTRQKGFDLLLRAFASLAPSYPEWDLLILGEGEERENLLELASSLGLSARVAFPGLLKNPFPELQRADLFVMSSRAEGFGNALTEAMACGLPVISFDCPSGPGEIIRDGIDGILVPAEDVPALARAMGALMSNPDRRRQLAEEAVHVGERFSMDRHMEQWEELFQRLALGGDR